MLDWYQKVFEVKVQYQNPAFAFLTCDDRKVGFVRHFSGKVGTIVVGR